MRETAVFLVLALVGVTAWRKRSFPLLAQAATGQLKIDPSAARGSAAGGSALPSGTVGGVGVQPGSSFYPPNPSGGLPSKPPLGTTPPAGYG